MTYISSGNKWTYGVKTLTEIDSISGMTAGETVFCSTIKRPLTYDGSVWMCGDFIRLTNVSGAAVSRGDLVVNSTTTAYACTTSSTSSTEKVIGPVVFGGNNNAEIAVAICGIYDINMGDSSALGDLIFHKNVSKQGTSNLTMGVGFLGICTTANGGSGLTRCMLKTKLEYS